MNLHKSIKIHLLYVGFISLLFTFFIPVSHATVDEAFVIFDNTVGSNNAAIFSNMATSNNGSCSKNDVLTSNSCNRFSLGQNKIQVIQNNGEGNIVSMVGVNNNKSTSYENQGKPTQSYLFSADEHLFKIDKLRSVATEISLLNSTLPPGSYGAISFQQFVNNIVKGQTMYGVVRVKIPLMDTAVKNPPAAPIKNDDGDDDGDGDSSNDDGQKDDDGDDDGNGDSSDDDGQKNDDGNDDSNDDDVSQVPEFKMCGDAGAAICTEECAVSKSSVLKAGMSICGKTLPKDAQINIMGSLLIDWINYDTKETIALNEFPSDPQQVSFEIAIPLNINPSNIHRKSQTMSSIQAIQRLTGSNKCVKGNECDVEITSAINFKLVPQSSIDMYKFKFGIDLDKTVFDTLSRADQYHLLFPSGYADGWSTALNALKISATKWISWGLYVENDSSGLITANSIRKESFEDIPALVYTGGLVRITHHTNISGLIYAAQALEISQKGIGKKQTPPTPAPIKELCVPKPFDDDSNDDGTDDDGSKDDDGKDDDGSKDDDTSSTCGAGDDDGSDDSSDDDKAAPAPPNKPVTPPPPSVKFVPSFQYLDGAIVVRNGFYFEALQPHGITLISNNPDNYSNTEIKRIGGKNNFVSYSDRNTNNSTDADSSVISNALTEADRIRLNGAKWIEIRPK